MKIQFDSLKPIYVQIAEAIEDDVVHGRLLEGESSYSQLVIAKELGVNPATAAKGINLLVTEGVLEKQRGLSMVVADGAKLKIIQKRRTGKMIDSLKDFITEAGNLAVSDEEVLQLVKQLLDKKRQEN